MSWLEVFTLALIQGVTEFLPVSSSGHLILGSQLLGWPDQGLAFDVAVHVGSLLAVLVYFRRDLTGMLVGGLQGVQQRQWNPQARLLWYLGLGTIPVGLFGLLLGDWLEEHFRGITPVALAMLVFAPCLWWADRCNMQQRHEDSLTLKDVALIGLAQVVALIPGVSRSGMTMLTALMLGLSRAAAARFSFLLSIPVIMLAGGLRGVQLIQSDTAVNWSQLGVGVMISALSAYACIHYFLKWLERMGYRPFAWYLLTLAIMLLTLT